MGNNCCNNQGAKEFLLLRKNIFVKEDLSQTEKIRILENLKKNDPILLDKILEKQSPLQNLYDEAYNFTFLHAAAKYDAYNIAESILDYIRKNHSQHYNELVNIVDRSFHTPAMLCVLNNSPQTLLILLTDGHVDFEFRNFQGQNLSELAKSERNRCTEILEYYTKLITNDQSVGKTAISSLDVTAQDDHDFEYAGRMLNNASKLIALKTINDIIKTKVSLAPQNSDVGILEGAPKNTFLYITLQNCLESGKVFEDNTFSKTLESNDSYLSTQKFKDVIWKRAHEILGCKIEEVKLFDEISWKSHSVENEYTAVQSVIAALSEFPSRICDIFLNKSANKFGVYSLRLFSNGLPKEIVIDDQFPVKKSLFGGGDWIFLEPEENILWGILIEKAVAKIFGGYMMAKEALIEDIIEAISGCPSTRHFIDPLVPIVTWNKLKVADEKNSTVICSTRPDCIIKGLNENRFTFLSVHEIQGNQFIKLRYPWDKVSFDSEFNKISMDWTEEQKLKLGRYDSSEGIIIMTILEFVSNFNYITMCEIHPGWELVNHDKLNPAKKGDYYTFINPTLNYAYFRLHYLSKNIEGRYPATEFIIAKENENKDLENLVVPYPDEIDPTCQEGAKTVYPSTTHRLRLLPGKYYIRIKQRGNTITPVNYSLSCFAESRIMIEECPKVDSFLSKLYRGDTRNSKKFSKMKNCFFYYAFNGNNAYIYAENKKPKKTWCLEVQFTELQNLKLGKPWKTNDTSMLIIVPPQSTQIAYVKSIELNKPSKFNWVVSQYWEKRGKNE